MDTRIVRVVRSVPAKSVMDGKWKVHNFIENVANKLKSGTVAKTKEMWLAEIKLQANS